MSRRAVDEVSMLSSSSDVVIQIVRREGGQRGGQEDQDQSVAKAVHPFRDPRPAMRGRSARRTRVSSGPQCVTSVFFRPRKSIRSWMLTPILASSAKSRAVPVRSSRRSQYERLGFQPLRAHGQVVQTPGLRGWQREPLHGAGRCPAELPRRVTEKFSSQTHSSPRSGPFAGEPPRCARR